MSDFNKVILMGRLTADPELRFTPNGTAVCSMRLASNRKYKQGEEWVEEVCFVNATAFGKQGENLVQHLTKASRVLVEGRLRFEQWEKDGKKGAGHSIIVESCTFLDSKPQGGEHA
jgi:single-strand DNA-binding protein